MILPDATITLDTGVFGTRGFTFSILGDEPSDGSEAPERSQGENPVFTADYNNNPFESGKIYLLTSFHPDYMDPTVVGRAVFNELGGVTFVSSAEAPLAAAAGSDVSTGYPHAEYQLTDPVTGQVSTWQWSELRQKFILVNSTVQVNPNLQQVLTNGNVGNRDIILKGSAERGNPQLFFDVGPTLTYNGLVFRNQNETARGNIGMEADGRIVLINGSNYVAAWSQSEFRLGTPTMFAGGTDAVYLGLGTAILQIAENPDYMMVVELDPITRVFRYKAISRSTFASNLLNDINRAQWAAALAPYTSSQTVNGDPRIVESPIHCYTETEVLNQQFIPITYSMLGVNQPHSLNTAGTGIWRSLQDADGQPTSYIQISFPDANHYRLTLGDSVAIDSSWTGELALIKKTPGAVVAGGGIRYVVTVSRLLSELPAAASLGHPDGKKLYLVPAGLTPPAVGSLVTPIGSRWEDYTGSFSVLGTDCAGVPTPVAGAPTFNAFSPPTLTPGVYYTYTFDMDAVTNPGGAGLTVYVSADGGMAGLNLDYPSPGNARIFGTPPVSLTGSTVSFPVKAVQSDGKTTNGFVVIPFAVPVADTGGPTWNLPLSPTPITPGSPGWFWRIPVESVTVHNGTSYQLFAAAHPWINFVVDNGYKLYGNPPADLTGPTLITLTAYQNADGKTADTVASIPLSTAQVPLVLAVQQLISSNGTRTMILRGGANFGLSTVNNPYETTTGPAGFVSRGKQQMRRWGTNVLSVEYTYDNDPGYTNAPLGTYYVTYETTDGRKKYASYVLGSSAMSQALSLSDTPPSTTPVAIAIERIDYDWQANPTRLRIYVKTNGGTVGSIEWSYEIVAPGGLETPAPGYGYPGAVPYSALTAGDYGAGYTLQGTKTGLPIDTDYSLGLNIFVRVVGTTNPIIIYQPPVPRTSNVSRTNIYPVGPAPTLSYTLYESFV